VRLVRGRLVCDWYAGGRHAVGWHAISWKARGPAAEKKDTCDQSKMLIEPGFFLVTTAAATVLALGESGLLLTDQQWRNGFVLTSGIVGTVMGAKLGELGLALTRGGAGISGPLVHILLGILIYMCVGFCFGAIPRASHPPMLSWSTPIVAALGAIGGTLTTTPHPGGQTMSRILCATLFVPILQAGILLGQMAAGVPVAGGKPDDAKYRPAVLIGTSVLGMFTACLATVVASFIAARAKEAFDSTPRAQAPQSPSFKMQRLSPLRPPPLQPLLGSDASGSDASDTPDRT